MTIDITNLSQEQRALLRANPELLESLEKTIPLQVGKVQATKKKLNKGLSKMQRDLEEVGLRIKEAKRNYIPDPQLRKISKKYQGILQRSESASKLICPKCKEADYGNKMNGTPWCMKCNTALIPKNMLEKWRKLPEIKITHNALKDELHRLNPGLNPDNKEDG